MQHKARPQRHTTGESSFEFFVEGSTSIDHNTGVKRPGYAAALEAEQLPTHFSSQAGELKALTEECKFTKEKITTIYMRWYMTL